MTILANATITERDDLTAGIARFRIRADGPLPLVEPGQYLTLGLVVDGRLIQRPYSTATETRSARDRDLEFLIRLVPDGAFTPRLWSMAAGDRLRLGPPKGRFTRIAGDQRTHLFVATGTGLAPFVAMLAAMRRDPAAPPAVVVHGVSTTAELAYRARLDRWAADGRVVYEPAISRPDDPSNAGWSGRIGRVAAILDDVWTTHRLSPATAVAYFCGNPEMISAGERLLRDRGLSEAAIRSEHYWPA